MAYYFPYLVINIIIVFYTKEIITNNLYFKMPGEVKNFTMRSHLKYKSVLNYCSHRDDFCRSNDTDVCALKMVEQEKIYKNFENGCYLFMSNMCDHPEEEYFILTAGSCELHLTKRREESEDAPTAAPDDEAGNNTNSVATNFSDNDTVSDAAAPGALREKSASGALLYKYLYPKADETTFDGRSCPFSCPNTYSPVCVSINRGSGKYFKMLTFVNRCSAYIYYCNNTDEFLPPPDESYLNVRASPLSWSFCGSNRFMQFARFSEAASSIGHFGWLAGDYKYSHIMEPHQRIPGYG